VIRALAISLCLAAPASAQTPVAVSAANDLRVCLLSAQGMRDAPRLAQLDLSIGQLRDGRWGPLTEIAPGVFRLSRAGTDRTVEIKLPDASGAAHCMIFGPGLSSGQGALTADKFVELGFATGLAPAAASEGLTRRYSVTGSPYQADLVSYSTAHGDVVGFVFAGVPQGQTTRRLSSGDASVTGQAVALALRNAIDVCLRTLFDTNTVDDALAAYGFDFGFSTGGATASDVYFTADNAVSVQIYGGLCHIDTNYAGPGPTVQIAQDVLNRAAPGIFVYRTEHNGCPAFYGGPRIYPPVFLTISNAQHQGRQTCIEDGTVRITVSVVG
jgi:hypothetical protein